MCLLSECERDKEYVRLIKNKMSAAGMLVRACRWAYSTAIEYSTNIGFTFILIFAGLPPRGVQQLIVTYIEGHSVLSYF